MSFIRYFIALLTFLLFTAASLVAQNKVLIIAGAGGTPEFENMFYQQAVGLHDLLIESFGYESKDIVVLVADTPDSIEQIYAKATAKNIRNYFVNDASGMSSQSNLFCFFIGHDSYDNEWGKFNISGKDLRDFDYSQLLNSVPFNKLLFINMASASGTFIDKLSKENRVIITATRDGFEKNATQFASQFLETLSNKENSDLNKDGRLSVTEIFIATRDRIVKYYDSKKQLRPEHPLLDDNGDGFGTEMPDLHEGDGMLANELYIAQTASAKLTSESLQGKPTATDIRRENILALIKALKMKKSSMSEDEYYEQLENLMLRLAELGELQK